MPLRLWLVILSFLVVSVTTPSTLAQTTSVDRPAELRGGTCDSLGEVVVPLANLVFASGDLHGMTGATPVEQSGTVVQFAIADFLTSNHVVVVRESPAVSTVDSGSGLRAVAARRREARTRASSSSMPNGLVM